MEGVSLSGKFAKWMGEKMVELLMESVSPSGEFKSWKIA